MSKFTVPFNHKEQYLVKAIGVSDERGEKINDIMLSEVKHWMSKKNDHRKKSEVVADVIKKAKVTSPQEYFFVGICFGSVIGQIETHLEHRREHVKHTMKPRLLEMIDQIFD